MPHVSKSPVVTRYNDNKDTFEKMPSDGELCND